MLPAHVYNKPFAVIISARPEKKELASPRRVPTPRGAGDHASGRCAPGREIKKSLSFSISSLPNARKP